MFAWLVQWQDVALPRLKYGFDSRAAHVIDPDELMDELEEQEELYEELVHRSIQQSKDIAELRQELEKLEEDIQAPEAEEDNASGVAQS